MMEQLQPEITIGRLANGDWKAGITLPSAGGPVEFTAVGFDHLHDAFEWIEGYFDDPHEGEDVR